MFSLLYLCVCIVFFSLPPLHHNTVIQIHTRDITKNLWL
jgi:hypothetical protein